jgi:hypothetical protein
VKIPPPNPLSRGGRIRFFKKHFANFLKWDFSSMVLSPL